MHQWPAEEKYGYEEAVVLDHRISDDDYEVWLKKHAPEDSGGWFGGGVMHNDWTARSFNLPEHLHHTNWTIHEAQKFLDTRDTARPFCMAVSFIASSALFTPLLIPVRVFPSLSIRLTS